MANTEKTKIMQWSVAGQTVELIRKRVRYLRLAVYPPDGRVRATAPWHAGEASILQFITSRLDWIRRQQARLASRPRPAACEYATGERHPYLGRAYPLNIIHHKGPGRARLNPGTGTLDLCLPGGSRPGQRKRALAAWYRQEMQRLVPGLIRKWEPVLGVAVAEWRIKQMKTRWGSCNTHARRIWLNLELAKHPLECLEYIVVHEMAHLLVPSHDAQFKAVLDKALPEWKKARAALKTNINLLPAPAES